MAGPRRAAEMVGPIACPCTKVVVEFFSLYAGSKSSAAAFYASFRPDQTPPATRMANPRPSWTSLVNARSRFPTRLAILVPTRSQGPDKRGRRASLPGAPLKDVNPRRQLFQNRESRRPASAAQFIAGRRELWKAMRKDCSANAYGGTISAAKRKLLDKQKEAKAHGSQFRQRFPPGIPPETPFLARAQMGDGLIAEKAKSAGAGPPSRRRQRTKEEYGPKSDQRPGPPAPGRDAGECPGPPQRAPGDVSAFGSPLDELRLAWLSFEQKLAQRRSRGGMARVKSTQKN